MLLLVNGNILDGSGAPAFAGSVLVEGERIRAVGPEIEAPAAAVIDCSGLTVAPGFIDVHSHSDLQVFRGDRAKKAQGVTSEVVGNCGFSAFPCGEFPEAVREYGDAILRGEPDPWCWSSARDYLADAAEGAELCHVNSLVGHGTLRTAVAGAKQGRLSGSESDRMVGLLTDCLTGGAVGLSTGLMYAPGSSAPADELKLLCSVVAAHGALYTTHMRSYADELLPAIDEQVMLARETGCRLQISHLQAVGKRNHAKQVAALEAIEAARSVGVDVAFDCYPYLAGSTVLTQLLPQEALDGGTSVLLARLADPEQRKRIAERMVAAMPQEWTDIVIASVVSPERQEYVGRTVADLAEEQEVAPVDFVFDLLTAERAQVAIVSFNQSEENLRGLLTHPLGVVISDGFYVKGRPHPRLYGTFPFLLGELVRERRWLTLEDAVHRVTGKPAERFGLRERGRIAEGYFADLVVFDPATVGSPATYDNPAAAPAGIGLVLREGRRIAGSLPD